MQAAPRVDTGLLVLADISGYTAFLSAVAEAHPDMMESGGHVPAAYPVISSLLDVVVESLAPTFSLAQVEGDAVFGYASSGDIGTDSEGVLAAIRSAYDAFRGRLAEARIVQADDCQACLVLGTLELKFVLHAGTYVALSVAGRPQLAGPAVNLAHRLLKNSVTARTGLRAYLLVTDDAATNLTLAPGVGLAHEEHYDDAGIIAGRVVALADPVRNTA